MKQLGVDTFAIVSLPAGAGLWPNRIVRDSFQSTNERQTIREDRTADAPATVAIGTSETSYYSASGGLDNLTSADFNRLLAEIEVPSFTAEQLPEGTRFVVAIEGREESGPWATLATVTIQGTGETTEPSTISFRPSVGSSIADVRASVARVGGVGELPAELELRVYYSADQLRRVRYLTGHILVITESTTSSAFQTFIEQDYVSNVILYHGESAGGVTGQVYSGAWVILNVTVDDNQNSTSLVRISVEQIAEWRDV